MNSRQRQGDGIKIGVSSCLLGHNVRFDGGHKQNRFITDVLVQQFDVLPFCPEMAIGLGAPRAPIRLQQSSGGVRALNIKDSSQDYTEVLQRLARDRVPMMKNLSGLIVKKDSPSCGMERVKVYDANTVPARRGRGVFTMTVMKHLPLLPVEEEGRLNDPILRESFLQRVFVYHRWQQLMSAQLTPKGLLHFHASHKYLVLSRHQQGYRHLGRLLAHIDRDKLSQQALQYISELLAILKTVPNRRSHANTLLHIAGHFKKCLSADDKAELVHLIHAYRQEKTPLEAPMTLLRHFLRQHPSDYLNIQYYLQPLPLTP